MLGLFDCSDFVTNLIFLRAPSLLMALSSALPSEENSGLNLFSTGCAACGISCILRRCSI
jgi:hypothetical protein